MKRILTITFILLSSILYSQTPTALFDKGVDDYYAEKYAEAAESFQQLYDMGYKNFDVCYNLGNSYFKVNDYPSSILYLERAKRIEPNNKDVQHNLDIVNKHIIDKIEVIPEMFYEKLWNNLQSMFSVSVWCAMNITLFALSVIFVSLIFIFNGLKIRKTMLITAIVSFLMFIFTFVVSSSINREMTKNDEAVVFTSTVTAKGSPAVNSVDLFVIHKGTKVTITDNIGEWIEIRLGNGKIGWIPFTDVTVI